MSPATEVAVVPGTQYCPPLAAAPPTTKARHTWTEHTSTCQSCRKLCRASVESIAEQRENTDCDGLTDAEVASSFEYCLQCCNGESHAGEHICNQCGGDGALTECPHCKTWNCAKCTSEPCDHAPGKTS